MQSMKPMIVTHSHGDLQNLEIIEDKNGARRKHGLPARYAKGRFLGKGGFAKVYEVQDMETKEVFAAKIVAKASIAKPRAMAKLRSEIAIHRSLDHDKVVKFYDHFEDSEHVYILLEICPNQTLNDFMRKRPNKRLSEQEAMFYLYELIMALKYLHRKRVIHRDLKLGNLFLDAEGKIKVGDFGLAALLERDGEKRRTICGTPNYIAPEILEGKHGHSYEVDVWSLGVILYTMIVGRPPFETSDVKTTYRRIRYNQYSFPDTVRISDQAKDLVTSILRTEPHSRPSLDEILHSTWFQSCGQLPPPVPSAVSAFGVSPRVTCSSARSDTPERGAADFARIDSPVARFPLRDRSPSPGVAPGSQNSQHILPRGQSATPLTNKQNAAAPPSYVGSMTPGRYNAGVNGRPPLASQRGNEENVAPTYGNTGAMPTAAKQALMNSGSAIPRSCSSSGRINAAPQLGNASPTPGPGVSTLRNMVTPQTSAREPVVSHRPASGPPSRDPSPLHSAGSANAPARQGQAMGESLARPATSAAHQSGGLHSGRLTGHLSTPRETRSRSTDHLQPVPHQPATPIFCDVDLGSSRTPCATPPETGDGAKHHWSPAVGSDSHRDVFDGRFTARGGHTARSEASGSGTFRLASTSRGASPDAHARTMPLEAQPELWVTKWVDYSSKYGVGYIMSDGAIGVYFNDSTKVILTPDGSQFDYVTRRTQEKPETRTTHTFESYPEDLKKKVTLLRHFKNYMVTDILEKKDGATMGESSLPAPAQRTMKTYEPQEVPYVKKWTRNKHAIMFQLSNKVVQVVFFDKTEAVLSSKSNTVTYVDKKGQVSSYPLKDILDVPNVELAKRLRYTKDILVNLLGTRTSDLVPH